MFAKIKADFVNSTAITHWLAGAFLFLYGAYQTVPAFAALVNEGYATLPNVLKQIVVAALALYLYYRNGQQPSAKP